MKTIFMTAKTGPGSNKKAVPGTAQKGGKTEDCKFPAA